MRTQGTNVRVVFNELSTKCVKRCIICIRSLRGGVRHSRTVGGGNRFWGVQYFISFCTVTVEYTFGDCFFFFGAV